MAFFRYRSFRTFLLLALISLLLTACTPSPRPSIIAEDADAATPELFATPIADPPAHEAFLPCTAASWEQQRAAAQTVLDQSGAAAHLNEITSRIYPDIDPTRAYSSEGTTGLTTMFEFVATTQEPTYPSGRYRIYQVRVQECRPETATLTDLITYASDPEPFISATADTYIKVSPRDVVAATYRIAEEVQGRALRADELFILLISLPHIVDTYGVPAVWAITYFGNPGERTISFTLDAQTGRILDQRTEDAP